MRIVRALGLALALVCATVLLSTGCATKRPAPAEKAPARSAVASDQPLPDAAYYADTTLAKWVDEESGYDTTREWTLDGEEYPVAVLMSPAQSPQFLVGMRDGIFQKKLEPLGVVPSLERIDGPPRTFRALERSKWPFVYTPLAVFMDYVRSPENQGGVGGLQYVLIAGSTAGGGYTLMSKDPDVRTLSDLKGRTVGLINYNPVPGTFLTDALDRIGLEVGEGSGQVRLVNGPDAEQMNKFTDGEYDAIVSLNIYIPQLMKMGAHKVTDFAKDTSYEPNYNVLLVERTVLEKRPEVVKAFLEAHAESQLIAEREWNTRTTLLLYENWNDFFSSEKTRYAKDRYAPDLPAFELMLGDMRAQDELDDRLVRDCFAYIDRNGTWGWRGTVDTERVYQPSLYEGVK